MSRKNFLARALRVETLESRELLSVNPLGIDQIENPVAQIAPEVYVAEAAASVGQPGNLAGTQTANSNDVVLTWTAAENATFYKVHRRLAGDTAWTLVNDNVSSNSLNVSANPAGNVQFLVRGYSDATTYGASANTTVEVTAVPGAPTVAPANLKAVVEKVTADGKSPVTLTWGEVPNATGYKVWRRDYVGPGQGVTENAGQPNEKVTDYTAWKVVSNNWAKTTITNSNVLPDKVQYLVRGVNADGTGPSANIIVQVRTTVDPGTPAKPANLTGSQVAGNVVLNWAADTKAGFYSVHRRLEGDTAWTLLNKNVTANTYTDSALSADGKYQYLVRGWANAALSGDSSNVFVEYSAATPAVPVITAAEQLSYTTADKGSVKLTFKAVDGAVSYVVKIGTATIPAANVGAYADGGIVVKGIDAVKSGSFTIASVNSAGTSAFSTSVSIRVDSLAPDASLTITSAEQVGPGTAKITFTEAADSEVTIDGKALSYNVFGSKDGAAYTTLASNVKYADGGLTVDGLSKGAWKFQIQAVNVVGVGPKSSEASASIGDAPAAPATPSAVQNTNSNSKSSVTLTVETTEATGTERTFTVYASKDGGNYVKLDVAGVTNNTLTGNTNGKTTDTVTVAGLEPGALYSFKVTVFDSTGKIESVQSNSSNVISLVDVPKAGANGTTFAAPTPVQTAAKTVQLRFSAVENAAYYVVAVDGTEYKVATSDPTDGTHFAYNSTVGGIVVDWSATGTTAPDDVKTWTVTAVNAAGTLESTVTGIISLVTTTPATKPVIDGTTGQTKAGTVKIVVTGADSATQQYKVFKSTDGGLTQTEVAAADLSDNTSTGVTVNNLALGTYTFFVLPTNFVGDGTPAAKSDASAPVTVVAVAAAPTGITAKQSAETIWLTFTQVGTITDYNVYASANGADYSTTPIQAQYVPGTADVPGHIVVSTGLTKGVNYRFKVAAVSGATAIATSGQPFAGFTGGIEGTQSAATAAITLVNVLAPPTKVEGTQTGAGQVKLTFDNVSGADSYKVYQNGTAIPAARVGSYANGGIVISGVTAGSVSFTVAAVNVAGEGAKSGAAAVTVAEAANIASVTGTQVGGGKVELTLVGVTGGVATSYIVKYSTDNTNYTTVAAANTTFENGKVYVTGLAVNAAGYSFTVTGVNAAGAGNESAGSSKVPVVAAPVAVTTPVATSDTENSAKLTFTQIQGVGNYIVYSSRDNFATGTTYTYASGGVAVTNHPAGNYTFKISYKSGVPELESTYSEESNSVAIKGTPDVPKDVKAANTAAGTVKLTFAAVPSVTGYEVFYGTDGTSYNKLTTGVSAYANGGITVTGLSEGNTNYFKVVAVNDNAVGPKESAQSAATTAVAVLVAPTVTNVKAEQTGDRTVTLTVTGTTGGAAGVTYTVRYSTDDVNYNLVSAAQVASNPGGTTTGTIVVNGLLEGQGYYFKVVASNTIADSQPSNTSGDGTSNGIAVVIAGTLAKLTGTITVAGGNAAGSKTLTFTPATGVAGGDTVTYQVYSSLDNYAAPVDADYTSGDDITTLPVGTQTLKVGYKVVHASTGAGDPAWTKYGALSDATASFTVLPAAPSGITALQVGESISIGKVELSGTFVDGDVYKVYDGVASDALVTHTITAAEETDGKFTVIGVGAGTAVTLNVSQVVSNVESAKFAVTGVAVVYKPAAPNVPTLTQGSGGSGYLKLTFTEKTAVDGTSGSSVAATYEVYASTVNTAPADTLTAGDTGVTSSTYQDWTDAVGVDTGVTDAATYVWVRAVNVAGVSVWVSVTGTVDLS